MTNELLSLVQRISLLAEGSGPSPQHTIQGDDRMPVNNKKNVCGFCNFSFVPIAVLCHRGVDGTSRHVLGLE